MNKEPNHWASRQDFRVGHWDGRGGEEIGLEELGGENEGSKDPISGSGSVKI